MNFFLLQHPNFVDKCTYSSDMAGVTDPYCVAGAAPGSVGRAAARAFRALLLLLL